MERTSKPLPAEKLHQTWVAPWKERSWDLRVKHTNLSPVEERRLRLRLTRVLWGGHGELQAMPPSTAPFNQVLSNAEITDICFSPDGEFLYLGDQNGAENRLTVYRVADPAVGTLDPVQGPITVDTNSYGQIAMHPTGKWLFVSGYSSVHTYAISSQGQVSLIQSTDVTTNLCRMQMDSASPFLYVLEVPQSLNQEPSSAIHCLRFDTENSTLQLIPGSAVEVGVRVQRLVLADQNFIVCLAQGNAGKGDPGTITSFALLENGPVGQQVDQRASVTPNPSCMSYRSGILYVGENSPATNAGNEGEVALSAFALSEAGVMAPIPGSPYAPPDQIGPNALLATVGSLYAAGSDGFYSDSATHLWSYVRNSQNGSLVLDGEGLSGLPANPTQLTLHPASRLVYLLLYGQAGGLYTYQSNSPLFGGTATVGPKGVTLEAQTVADVPIQVKSVGFYFGTDWRPSSKDTTLTCELLDNSFQTILEFDLITGGVTYYSRPFLELESGELYLGNISSFQVNYPTVTGFWPQYVGIGRTLTIQGVNFSAEGQNLVSFAGPPPEYHWITAIAVLESGQLKVTVPSGAYSGPIFVTSDGIPGPLSQNLYLQETPEISPDRPDFYGITGATLEMSVKYAYPPDAVVNFGDVTVELHTLSTGQGFTSASVELPKGMTSGPITVTSHGVTSAPSTWSVFAYSLIPAGLSTVVEITFGGGQYLALTQDGTMYSSDTGLNDWRELKAFEDYTKFCSLSCDSYGVCYITAQENGQGFILWGQPGQAFNGTPSSFSNITRLLRAKGDTFFGLQQTGALRGYLITGNGPTNLKRLPDFPSENWEVVDLIYVNDRLLVIGGKLEESTTLETYYSEDLGFSWDRGGDFPVQAYLKSGGSGELRWDSFRSQLVSTYGHLVVTSRDLGLTWELVEMGDFSVDNLVIVPMASQLAIGDLGGWIVISKKAGVWQPIEQGPLPPKGGYAKGATNGTESVLVGRDGQAYLFKQL